MLRFRKCSPGCGAAFEKLAFISITAETGPRYIESLGMSIWWIEMGLTIEKSSGLISTTFCLSIAAT